MSVRNISITRKDLTDATPQGVLQSIAEELKFAPGLLRITVDLERMSLRTERASAALAETPYEQVKVKAMKEMDLDGKGNPYEDLFNIFELFRQEEMYVTHVLCGSTKFHQWLRLPRRATSVLGRTIQTAEELPDDVFLICGSGDSSGLIADVELSVKCTLP